MSFYSSLGQKESPNGEGNRILWLGLMESRCTSGGAKGSDFLELRLLTAVGELRGNRSFTTICFKPEASLDTKI